MTATDHSDAKQPGAPLDALFRPPVVYLERYRREAARSGEPVPLTVALQRPDGQVSRHDMPVLPPEHEGFVAGRHFIERWIKFLLWSRGAHRIDIGADGKGARAVADSIRHAYAAGGERAFDAELFARIFDRPFTVSVVPPEEVPAEKHETSPIGGHFEGCRIGFDLGASDYKVAAVIDGETVYSDELPWQPGTEPDPAYHLRHVRGALAGAAEHLPRVDAIGGSAAGIYVDNRVCVASLFRAVPRTAFDEHIEPMFVRLGERWGVPLHVINDGDVTALAGALALDTGAVLGIAMGSSEAGGYLDRQRHLTGWLNEFAFCPVDLQRGAGEEEWSGDRGVGATYFSQRAVARLAQAAAIDVARDAPLPEQLETVQALMDGGDRRARAVFETIGTYLGYTVPWYREHYDFDTVLLLGRVTSGAGGEVLLRRAREVLEESFPRIAQDVDLRLPDEKTRRVGQAVAAASLPPLPVRTGR